MEDKTHHIPAIQTEVNLHNPYAPFNVKPQGGGGGGAGTG